MVIPRDEDLNKKDSFLALYDKIPLGFYIYSFQENKFTYANHFLLNSLGYTLSEFLSLDTGYLFPENVQRQRFYKLLKEKGRVHNHNSPWVGKNQTVSNFIESAVIQNGHFEGFVHDIASFTSIIESLNQKKSRYERLITDVIHTVHKSINFPDAIENIFDAIVNNIERADTLSIYLVEGDFAVMKNRRGFPESFLNRAGRIPKPKGITWKVILEGKPYYSPDVDTDPIAGPAASQMGVKCCYTLPLSINEEVIGALNIHCLRFKNAFDEDDFLTFQMLGSQIELALNNARQNELLSKSEEQYRILFNQSPVGVFIFNNEYKITNCNDRFLEILQTSREKIIGLDLLSIEDQSFTSAMQEALTGKTVKREGFYEATTSKAKLWLSVFYSPLIDPSGNVTGGMAVVQDITKRIQAEQALQNSDEKYRGLFEDNPLMSFVVNPEGKVISLNRSAEAELGYSRDELIGKSVLEVFHPDERTKIRRQLHECLENPKTLFSWQSRKLKKNGSLLEVREFSRALQDLDGKVYILVMCENITDKIKIENKLRERQKLAAIGEMAASIAHEINTPLGGIKMAADSLKRYFGHGPSLELLDMQDALIDQLKNIINPLLDFTRKTPLQKINHNVSSLLHLAIYSLNSHLDSKEVKIQFDKFDERVWCTVDVVKIRQVFFNVLKNAVEALSPSGGRIVLNLYSSSNNCVIEVIDNGSGIPKENIEKIFIPFYTTKDTGVGLGMAIVKNIIDLHGGDIETYSILGIGTRIKIILPF